MNKNKISKTRLDHLNSHTGQLNRRQFVGLGLLGATSTVLLNSPLNVFSRAFAGEALGSKKLAYLGFDLAGGAGLIGNFLVGKQDGPEDLLKSYSQLGWNPRAQGYDSRFGLPMAKADVSQIFKGMIETMSPGAQAHFRMASFCHISRDDSTDNPLSIVQMISKIQSKDVSRTIKLPIGTTASSSGGNSRSVKELSDFSAIRISNLQDVINMVAIPSPLTKHSKSEFKIILERLSGLNRIQLKKITNDDEIIKSLLQSYEDLPNMVGLDSEFDPRVMIDAQKIYSINSKTPTTNNNAIRAGIVSSTLSHQVGGAVISINGCDYHDGTSTTGDIKDLEIGREIGRAVELAHVRKEALFIHLFSDGSMFSNPDSRQWAGDDGEKSLSVIGLYDPNQAPAYRSKKCIQIGSFTDGQGVNRDSLIGATPALGSYAIFVNYLNSAGLLSQVDEYLPRIFTSEELEQILVFNS